jgi:hypothetical protein
VDRRHRRAPALVRERHSDRLRRHARERAARGTRQSRSSRARPRIV